MREGERKAGKEAGIEAGRQGWRGRGLRVGSGASDNYMAFHNGDGREEIPSFYMHLSD